MSAPNNQSQQSQQGSSASSPRGLVSNARTKVKETKPEKLLSCMRIFNIIVSICAIATGVSTMAATSADNCGTSCKLSFGVIAFYTIIFGTLLLTFELRSNDKLKDMFMRNFGFLYAHRGKATLVIFLGTLILSSISTSLDRWGLNLGVGLLVALNGIFECFVYYAHPTFSKVNMRPDAMGLMTETQGTSRGIDLENANNFSTNNANRSDYEFGQNADPNLGPAYGYNESPFTVAESTPQPVPMEANPYADAVVDQGPFGQGNDFSQANTSNDNDENPFATK